LADFKLTDFDVKEGVPEEQRSAPVQLTPDERTVQSFVEEISEELKA